MASDYGINFGFRRSDESVRTSEGRVKTPATGPLLLIGTAVEIDPVNGGYLRVAAAAAKPRPGTCGLLVQEEVWDRSIYERERVDSFVLGLAKPNRLSVITTGAGTKVTATTMFLATNVAVGRGLAWDGAKFIDVADPTDPTSFGEVTFFDAAKGYVEMVLAK
jgi:hypothetical protein